MPGGIDLAEASCSGRLRRRIPLGVSCLEIAGSGGIRSDAPMFYLTVWFQRERFEAGSGGIRAVNIMEHAFSFHGAGGE